MDKILLNGRKVDPHTKGISNELEKLGENYVIMDIFSNSDYFQVQFIKGLTKGKIKIKNEIIDLTQVKSVWNTSPLSIKIAEELEEETKNFVKAEWTEGINSLWNSINAKWVNHPISIMNAVNRLKQLKLGTEVGLKTPNTVVTNNPNFLRKFYDECNGEIIAKTLHSSEGLSENKMLFTTKISNEDIERT